MTSFPINVFEFFKVVQSNFKKLEDIAIVNET